MNALKLTIFFGERNRVAGELTARALGRLLASRRMRHAMLLRGREGFGLKHPLMTGRLLTLSEDLPLVWVAIDAPARIREVAREIDALLPQGLVTLERIWIADAGRAPVDRGDDAKLTIYFRRGERYRGRPAHEAALDVLRALGVEGASVLLGVDGVRGGRRTPARLLARNREVPTMILAVGSWPAAVAALAPLTAVLDRPLLTLERVRLLRRDGERLAEPRPPAPDGPAPSLWHKVTVLSAADSQATAGPLYVELNRGLRMAGISGCTVLGGVVGYSGDGPPHADRFLSLRRRVPVIVVTVDLPSRMAAAWPAIAAATRQSGLVVEELVPAFRARGPEGGLGGLTLAEPP